MEGEVLDLWATSDEPVSSGGVSSTTTVHSFVSNKYAVQCTSTTKSEFSAVQVKGSMSGDASDDESDEDGGSFLCKRVFALTKPPEDEFDYDDKPPSTAPWEVKPVPESGAVQKQVESQFSTGGEKRAPTPQQESHPKTHHREEIVTTTNTSHVKPLHNTSQPVEPIMTQQSPSRPNEDVIPTIAIPIRGSVSKSPPPLHPSTRTVTPSPINREEKPRSRASSLTSTTNKPQSRKSSMSAFTPVNHIERAPNTSRPSVVRGRALYTTEMPKTVRGTSHDVSSSNSITPESESRSTGDFYVKCNPVRALRKSCAFSETIQRHQRPPQSTASVPLKAFEEVLADVTASLCLLHATIANDAKKANQHQPSFATPRTSTNLNTASSAGSYAAAQTKRRNSYSSSNTTRGISPNIRKDSVGYSNSNVPVRAPRSSSCVRDVQNPNTSVLINTLTKELNSTQSEVLQLRADLCTTMKIINEQSAQINQLKTKLHKPKRV